MEDNSILLERKVLVSYLRYLISFTERLKITESVHYRWGFN